jgi:hypothetical protein
LEAEILTAGDLDGLSPVNATAVGFTIFLGDRRQRRRRCREQREDE